MEDVHYVGKLEKYKLDLKIIDYGERLDDYEGFWKWFIEVRSEEKTWYYKAEGPEGGYYGKKEEAIEELLEHLEHREEFDFEEESLAEIKKHLY